MAAFATVVSVLQHPRCLNCHPTGDRPLQFDDSRPHAMNVQRGEDDRGRAGLRCAACHGASNRPGPHLPPGVSTGWHLAPRDQPFQDQSPRALAQMLRDGERDGEALLEHVEHDPLVQWGWSPGEGREPVDVPHAEFVAAFRVWVEAGMPLPAEEQ